MKLKKPGLIAQILIAIYMALDGMGTACNLTGDGAIALVVDRISDNGRAQSA